MSATTHKNDKLPSGRACSVQLSNPPKTNKKLSSWNRKFNCTYPVFANSTKFIIHYLIWTSRYPNPSFEVLEHIYRNLNFTMQLIYRNSDLWWTLFTFWNISCYFTTMQTMTPRKNILQRHILTSNSSDTNIRKWTGPHLLLPRRVSRWCSAPLLPGPLHLGFVPFAPRVTPSGATKVFQRSFYLTLHSQQPGKPTPPTDDWDGSWVWPHKAPTPSHWG